MFPRLLPYLVISIIFTGCSASQHYMDFMVPSDVYIPADVRDVLVINRAAPESRYGRIIGGPEGTRDIQGLDLKIGQKFLDELQLKDTILYRYNWVETDMVPERGNAKWLADTLTTEILVQTCDREQVDAILSVEGVESAIIGRRDVDFTTGYPQGYDWFEIQIDMMVRMYDCKRKFIGDEYIDRARRNIIPTLDIVETSGKVPVGEQLAYYVAELVAERYYERIAPHWEGDFRKIYATGSDKLKEAYFELSQNGNIEKAIEIWKNLAQTSSGKEAKRSYFNMALASEIQGNPEIGLMWLDEGIEKFNDREMKKYKVILERQVKTLQVIEEQLGY